MVNCKKEGITEMNVLKEACIDSYLEAKRAWELGADRIELCDNLKEGGTTPSFGTIKMAKEALNIPIFTIIRLEEGILYIVKKKLKLWKWI